MSHNELLETFAASYLRYLELGYRITKTREGAIAYAAERSTAGKKAVELALARFDAIVR